MKKILLQYKITFQILWKLFLMNISRKPFNYLSLEDYFELETIIQEMKENDNIITSTIYVLSIIINKDEDIIREFKTNRFTTPLLIHWIKVIFKKIEYKNIDFTNSNFSNFIDNDKLLQLGKKYDAIKIICERNGIKTNKAQDCLEFYFSYIDYCNSLKKKFQGVFLKKEDVEEVEDEGNTFSSSQNKVKEQMRNNWLWYDILDQICQGDITKYDKVLNMPADKVLTKLAHLRYLKQIT